MYNLSDFHEDQTAYMLIDKGNPRKIGNIEKVMVIDADARFVSVDAEGYTPIRFTKNVHPFKTGLIDWSHAGNFYLFTSEQDAKDFCQKRELKIFLRDFFLHAGHSDTLTLDEMKKICEIITKEKKGKNNESMEKYNGKYAAKIHSR